MPEFVMPGRTDPCFQKLDSFTQSYIEAAIFTDEEQLGGSGTVAFQQLAQPTLARMVIDCAQFQRRAHPILELDEVRHRTNDDLYAQAGHDFWLTRNGHGAGFWDGDWSDPAGARLDEITKKFRPVDLYRGDDGRIHL